MIINLHPDIAMAWGAYLDFKKHLPGFPVLLFMCHNNLISLKSTIKEVLRQKPPNPTAVYRQNPPNIVHKGTDE